MNFPLVLYEVCSDCSYAALQLMLNFVVQEAVENVTQQKFG